MSNLKSIIKELEVVIGNLREELNQEKDEERALYLQRAIKEAIQSLTTLRYVNQ